VKLTARSEIRPAYLRGVMSRRKHKGSIQAVMMEIHITLSLSRSSHTVEASNCLPKLSWREARLWNVRGSKKPETTKAPMAEPRQFTTTTNSGREAKRGEAIRATCLMLNPPLGSPLILTAHCRSRLAPHCVTRAVRKSSINARAQPH